MEIRSLRDLKKDICNMFGVQMEDFEGPRRFKTLCAARELFCLRARQETSASLPEIAQAIGRRDHTTVISYLKKFRLPPTNKRQ